MSVVLVALCGGIFEELLPERSAMRSHLRLVAGLSVLLVLILPAKDALRSLSDFVSSLDLSGVLSEGAGEEYEELTRELLTRYSTAEAERLVAARITEALSLKEGTCRAVITLSESGELARVTVLVSGRSILESPYEIEEFVNAWLSCPCDVIAE